MGKGSEKWESEGWGGKGDEIRLGKWGRVKVGEKGTG